MSELALAVVGIDKEPGRESHLLGVMDRVTENPGMPVECYLQLEPENPHDPEAIAAYLEGTKVGYIAKSWHPLIKMKVPSLYSQPVTAASIYSWGRSVKGKLYLEVLVHD